MTARMSGLRPPALLFCPGDRPDRFGKAAAAADTVILDLEDAVAPERKARARDEVVRAMRRLEPADPADPDRTVVRVNGAGTPWHDDDIAALAELPGVVVMLPMAADVAAIEALAPRPVIALCETAAGVLAAPALAAAGNCVGLMWGSEDLVADLGGRPGRTSSGTYPPAMEEARTRILYAARAAGVMPIDTVLADIADLDLLRADSIAAVSAGFAAKACIHPSQVAVVREAFRPTPEQIRWARDVTAAAATAPAVFQFAGQMVDAPVLAHAAEVLRQTEAPPRTAAGPTTGP
jgi:citrate lyase subunit beta / citryl-CoA lyase